MPRLARLLAALAALVPTAASADPWDDVVARLAPGATIHTRTETRLEVQVAGEDALLCIGTHDEPDCDLFFDLTSRRGRNPYRTWYVRRSFLRGRRIPKRRWPRYLRIEFLRLLRVED